jgi:nucleotide-binding universal stress UspA family protein
MTRQIVIGYDGSPHGEDALALGRVLAEVLAAEALVVVVIRIPDHLVEREQAEAAADREAAPLVAAATQRLAGLDVRTRTLVDDSPARALHELAEAEHPLAVVVGASHRGAVGRVFMGSVGASLLSGAPCSIAIAPHEYAAREGTRLLRIGVAYDDSAESQVALAAAASLSQRVHAALSVVAVATPSPYSYSGAFEVLTGEEYETGERKHKRQALDRAIERLPPELHAERHLLVGDAAGALAEKAEDLDLLVVGSRGYGPLRRVLLGGVASRLMQTAPCPMLIVPRGAGDDPLAMAAAPGDAQAHQPLR